MPTVLSGRQNNPISVVIVYQSVAAAGLPIKLREYFIDVQINSMVVEDQGSYTPLGTHASTIKAEPKKSCKVFISIDDLFDYLISDYMI